MAELMEKLKRGLISGRYSLLIVGALVVYFWYPAIFDSKTMIHGDSVHHGLPLFYLHQQALFGDESVLWSNKIYGGHPLFAEGQGGYANPLNIAIALLFDPRLGHQLVHILGMAIAAFGVFCLARQLRLSYWSSTFAALASGFSTQWIAILHNYTASSTLAWLPWMMVACEYWIKTPSFKSALALSITTALSVLAGYPQLPYGMIIYMIVSLFPMLFYRETRINLKANWKRYLYSGSISLLLFIGLSAVQTLPLSELVGQSHRNEGIGFFINGLDFWFYIKGLFFNYQYDISKELDIFNVPSMGSLMVFSLSMMTLFIKLPNRILGHLMAAFLLFNLGMQDSSPIFRFIYEHHLIPGLHYHRIMHPFLSVAVIGIAILSAFVVESASKQIIPLWVKGSKTKYFALASILVMGALLFFAVKTSYNKTAPYTQIGTFIAAFLCILVLRIKNQRFIPMALTLILALECLSVKIHLFHFAPWSVTAPPEIVVEKILNDPLLQEYKTHDNSGATGMVFFNPTHPRLEWVTERLMYALPAFMGLVWGLPSIDGALALEIGRHKILRRIIEKETFNEALTTLNVIDLLGIKYISTNRPTDNPALELVYFDKKHGIYAYKNKHAQPRFQIYTHYEFVDSYEEAFKKIKAAKEKTLFLERPENGPEPPVSDTENGPHELFDEKTVLRNISYIEKSSKRYALEIDVNRSAWLFLADANYPGWKAEIDGHPTTLYGAQVLGKAVQIPPGKHHVVILYYPKMFYTGISITFLTILIILFKVVLSGNIFRFSQRSAKDIP